MDPQEQLRIGKEAEDFLQYVSEHPYFSGLLERIKLEYARQLLGLNHTETAVFTDLRCRTTGIDDIMNAVRGDIAMGTEALKEIDVVKETGGLL